jgi:uncharacterized repeat protein (TIGR02543 family)
VENPADVVLLHIGTNDVESGQGVAGIVLEVGGILDNIDLWASNNGVNVTVVLARLILRSDNVGWNQTTVAFDDALEAMALARIAAGDHIITVDMEHALSYPADLSSDGIHPTSAGYSKMANAWYNVLDNLLSGHSLTVNYVGSGVVTRFPDQSAYSYGATVSLTAQANIGWTFSGWSGDLTGESNPATITMDGNKTVTATFTQNQYTLTMNYVGNGFVTKLPNQATYTYGTIVNLTAQADDGWTFSGWSGDASGFDRTTSVIMNSDATVTATFTENTPPQVYLFLNMNPDQNTLSLGQLASFSVNVFNQLNPLLNSTLTLTITSPKGYSYYDFQPINVSANSVAEYSFSWVVPNIDGKYVVETDLVPAQLTAYDVVWLDIGELSAGFADSNGSNVVVSENLLGMDAGFFVLVESQVVLLVFWLVFIQYQNRKLLAFSSAWVFLKWFK